MKVRTQDCDVWVQARKRLTKTQPCNSLAGRTDSRAERVWSAILCKTNSQNYLHTDSCNCLDYHPNEQDHSEQDQRSLAPYGDITASNNAETREFSLLLRDIQYAMIAAAGVGTDNLVLFDYEKGERHRS